MRVHLDFQDDRLELDVPDESLVGTWAGPQGLARDALDAACAEALDRPLDFPPFRQAVVPGDRVAIAIDADVPGLDTLLGMIAARLAECDVDAGEVTVVYPAGRAGDLGRDLPAGLVYEEHNPDDSSSLAYLATTESGRRVYLNRRLTDADVVVPVARVGYDPVLGYLGPWSLLYPTLADREAHDGHRDRLPEDPHERGVPRARVDEALEVNWLLGSQFQVGIVPGASGVARCIGGLSGSVLRRGVEEVDRLWSFHAPARAECVAIGVGAPGRRSGLVELVEGLVTASRVVRHGGQIVALSRAGGSLGPSLQRLVEAGDVRRMVEALRGHDDDPDSITGRSLARVLNWADVYLLSDLDRQAVEDLSMVALDRAEDARRLVARSGSCLVIGRAEWTRATAQEVPSG